MRLAAELGDGTIPFAVVDRAGMAPRVLSAAPVSVPVVDAVRAMARRYGELDELVLVHPPEWSADAFRAVTARLAGCATSIRGCAYPVAAAREVAAGAPLPPGPIAVLRLEPGGAQATVLPSAELCDAAGALRTPGRALAADPVEALATSAAEAGLAPYALTGGVVLIPAVSLSTGLVERLTDLLGTPPLLPADPLTLAVRGALRPSPRCPSELCASVAETSTRRARDGCLRRRCSPAESLSSPALLSALPSRQPQSQAQSQELPQAQPQPSAGPAPSLAAGLLPPPNQRRFWTAARAWPLLAALVAGLLTAWCAGLVGEATGQPVALEEATGKTMSGQVSAPAGIVAQYDYIVRLPPGWQHSGGEPKRRRTLLTPVHAPRGSEVISIEQSLLGYDSAAEPDRAYRELRDRFQQAVDAGAPLSEFTFSTRVAGREVIAYRQRQPNLGAEVEWYVMFERDAQFSVGCQHTPRGADLVRTACAEVVASLRARP